MGERQIPSLLKHCYRKLSGNARKIIKKDIQGISSLKVVEKRLEGDTCSGETRCAPP